MKAATPIKTWNIHILLPPCCENLFNAIYAQMVNSIFPLGPISLIGTHITQGRSKPIKMFWQLVSKTFWQVKNWKLFANDKAVWDIFAEAIAVTWIFLWSRMPSSSKVSFVHKSLIRPWRRPWPTWPPPCPPSSSQFSSSPSSQRRSLVCQGLPHSCQGPVPVPCDLKHVIRFLVVIFPMSSKYLQRKSVDPTYLLPPWGQRTETSKP